jgi:hypothetical protein
MEDIVYPTIGREELNLTVAAGQGAGQLSQQHKYSRWRGILGKVSDGCVF